MKNVHTLLILFLSVSIFATETKPINAPIDKVIVYQEGAQVSRLTSLSIQSGQHTLVIGSLSNQIQENSIQVSLGKEVMIEAIALKDDYKSDPALEAEIKKIRAASKVLYDSIGLKDAYLRIYSEEKTMILANHQIKGQEGLTAQSLQDFSNFYRQRMMEIENKMLSLKYEKEDIIKRHTKLGQEMAKIKAKQGTPLKMIEIIYSAKAANEVQLNIKYLISEASWTPNYDVREKRLKRPKRRKGNSIAGVVRDRSGLPLIGASILEKGTTNGTITDIDGAFSSRKTEYQVPLAIKKNVTQRIFDIDIPYSISSDGRNNKVTLLTYNIDSDYRYEIVPKVEEKAYLVASINDWYQYELLSGNMNIYFDGIYQGDYFLDLDKEQENLQLSIGVDNNIKVSRKPSKDFKDGNLFGDKVTSKKSWDIEVYNGHAYAAAFHLVDQIPISKTDRINVDIKELGEGELNKETGIVKWKKNISGKSSEKIILKYNVKAKKKDNVIVE